ncbi:MULTISPECIES: hypothetical protein [unclassified Streptomyces]|uniref:hypothetical protein n=1 Tax=unclassified Streptomyces TaxID=2593676 RepID=UPI000938A7E9|nr:hypothetical protein [Streptomyces sp. TSRI0107]OKJ71164.1 hypothetical protein AMK31_35435 [Streptomyces sp. TSRI0107]
MTLSFLEPLYAEPGPFASVYLDTSRDVVEAHRTIGVVGGCGVHGLLEVADGGLQVRRRSGPLEPGLQRGPEVGQIPRAVGVVGRACLHAFPQVIDGSFEVMHRAPVLKPTHEGAPELERSPARSA